MRSDARIVKSIRSAHGEIALPGSKSMTIRTLLLAALSPGRTRIVGALDSDDTRIMRRALIACGAPFKGAPPDAPGESVTPCDLLVQGATRFPRSTASIDVGNSGLSIRTLVPVLAFMGGHYQLAGVNRMHERPIGDLVDALRRIGASIRYLGRDGFPPLAIAPPQSRSIEAVVVNGSASSQFVTGLMQAAPLLAAAHDLELVVEGELISRPYVEMTQVLMKRFGVPVQGDLGVAAPRFSIECGAAYQSPGTAWIEGDASSASYFLALGLLSGGPITVRGLGVHSVQGDLRFVDVLRAMGASVDLGDRDVTVRSPGVASGWRPSAFDLDLNHIPDAAMTAAVLAAFADGPCTLRNIASWRVKETDRLAAMACELRKCGAQAEEGPDCLVVTPARAWSRCTIDTYEDHRMAMCFALLACAGIDVEINDPDCVAKTFPNYFSQLDRLTGAGSESGLSSSAVVSGAFPAISSTLT